MKRWKKIVFAVLIVLFALPVAAYICIQIPQVQTYLCQRAAKMFSENLDGDVTVGKVAFSFPNGLVLKRVVVTQSSPQDTVLALNKLYLDARPIALINNMLVVSKVKMEEGFCRVRYVNDSTTNIAILLAPMMTESDSDEESTKLEDIFSVVKWDRLLIDDFYFSLKNDFALDSAARASLDTNVLNLYDIDARDITVDLRHIRYRDTASFKIHNIKFREKCGYNLKSLRADVVYGKHGSFLNNIHYEDDDSHFDISRAGVKYADINQVKDIFTDLDVEMKAEDIHVNFNTLKHLIGLDAPISLNVSGDFNGPISNIRSDNLKIFTDTRKTMAEISARVKGLPDLETSMLDVAVKNLYTTSDDIATMIAGVDPSFDKKSISKFAPGQTISFDGSLQGLISDFVAFGNLNTDSMGGAHLDAVCRKNEQGAWEIDGGIQTSEIDLGGILQSESLGKLTCEGVVAGSLGKNLAVDLDSLKIGNLGLMGYDYSDIFIDGHLSEKDFSGLVISKDPNLDLVFKGLVNLTDKKDIERCKANIEVNYANLHALNLDSREVSTISFGADADIVVREDGKVLGNATISNIYTSLADGKRRLQDIKLRAYVSDADQMYLMSLTSGFADVLYRGSAAIPSFISDLQSCTVQQHLDHLAGPPQPLTGNDYRLSVFTHDMRYLCGYLASGLYIADSTAIRMNLSANGNLSGNLKSSLIAYGDNYLKDLSIDFSNQNSSLLATAVIDLIQSGEIHLYNNKIGIGAADNFVELKYSFNNPADKKGTGADIHTLIEIPDPKETDYVVCGRILESEMILSGNKWSFAPADFGYREKHIEFEDFNVSNGRQFINIDGTLGENLSDTATFKINRFDLSALNGLFEEDFSIGGVLDADGKATAIFSDNLGLAVKLNGKNLVFRGSDIGDLNVVSGWNTQEKRFDILVRNTLADSQPLSAGGYYNPSNKNVYLSARINELGLNWLEPMLTDVVRDLSGSISGDITVKGPLDRLDLQGQNTRFNHFGLVLDYTNVPYVLDGPFSVNSKGVRLTNVTITDSFGHQGKVSGSVNYDHFKDIQLNTRFTIKNLHALNLKAGENPDFYGTAFASGSISLRGPMDKIKLGINVTTDPKTSIDIPLSGASSSRRSILTFVGNEPKHLNAFDSLRFVNSLGKVEEAGGGSQLDVDLRVKATTDALIQLVVDPNTGDAVKARGNGDISIIAADDFTLQGDYNIEEGSYKLTLMGLVTRDFNLLSGSSISLNGDIMQSDLDLKATYRTKASISTLIADSTSVGTRRYVDCGINVTGKLENPQIAFTVDIPDLDPSTKDRVDAALSTEEKRLQQVLALLVSGSFVPDEQSGIVNNSTILYSNASEIMSNQLNQIFQRLEIPIDLGFKYQPTSNGRNIFDVAISTQLFNNRVTINGNIGNRQYVTSSRSEVVGDIDVEIKLNKSGRVRLNLFSHSADAYTNYLDQMQRNGIGLVYQEEFDTWKEFWRKTFWSKDKRERVEQEELAARRQAFINEMRERYKKEKLPEVESPLLRFGTPANDK